MSNIGLNGKWEVESNGPDNLEITHPTAPYSVILNENAEYVLIKEKLSSDGQHTGQVFPIIRYNEIVNEWEVYVTDNARPCNRYLPLLMEGARKSAQNPQGNITTDGLPLTLLGEGHSNSARIMDFLLIGVCIVKNGTQITVKANAIKPRWVTFLDFSRNSKDMMVKSALFDFLMQRATTGN